MSNNPVYKGARFYKCALQVNPHNYSKNYQGGDIQDEDTYNQKILENCRNNSIEIVGIADHGNVSNSETLRTHLRENGIVVFPGFEIASSEKIHMVCLYSEDSTDDQLNQFLGQLMGANNVKLETEPTHPSSLSCEEIAGKILNGQNGFWYAAHCTGNNGLLKLSGSGDNYVHLWKNSLVEAVQIPGAIEDLCSGNENTKKYRDIIENKNSDYKRTKNIAVINAKDVGSPEQLSNSSASCMIKMTNANFPAFRNAFKDPQSRIRLNHESSSNFCSAIESVEWSGAGLFETQGIALSNDLNTFIGGRGTGKSTLIESIRFALDLPFRGGNNTPSQNIQSSNLRNSRVELKVRSASQYGQKYTVSRRYGEAPVVKDQDDRISHLTPRELLPEIELLGQNEILRIEQSETDKLALLEKFLPDTQVFSSRIDEAKHKLKENRKKLIYAREKLDLIEERINREDWLKEQRTQYQSLGIEAKLKDSALLEKEKQLEERIDDQLDRIKDWYSQYEDLFDLDFIQASNTDHLLNKEIISQIRELLGQMKISLDNLVKKITEEVDGREKLYKSKRKEWKVKSDNVREQINLAITKLPEQAGKSGKEIGKNYQKVIADLTSVEVEKREYKNQIRLINALSSDRESLLEEYRDTAFKRYQAMNRAIQDLNENALRRKVKISVSRCKNLKALKEFMQEIEDIGPAKTRWLDEIEDIDLKQWSKWIEKKSQEEFNKKYKSAGLTGLVTERLFSINYEQRLKLEEIELEDTVRIELNIAHESESNENYVSMEDLSIGQKCTAILNLLLIKRNDPLIIDQPEDHLDNAFIAERIVSELRRLKTDRQFLFATHNPNIPVFGDAELIVVLENRESKTTFRNVGSIDDPAIRDQTAQILEGGRAAFDMRKEKYGF